MNELPRRIAHRINPARPGVPVITEAAGGRQILQSSGSQLPPECSDEREMKNRQVDEAINLLVMEAAQAGIDLLFQHEHTDQGEVIGVIDRADSRILRRIPLDELLRQVDRQKRQGGKQAHLGLLVDGTA